MKKKNIKAFLILMVLVVVGAVTSSALASDFSNPASWSFTLVSTGDDASWVSTTRVNPAYLAYGYNCQIDVFDLELDGLGFQSYLGEIADSNSDGTDYDGLAATVMYDSYDANGLTADLNIWIDEQGYAHADLAGITLSQWGGLDVLSVEISGSIDATGLKKLWYDDFSSYADGTTLGQAADWETTLNDGGQDVYLISSDNGKCIKYSNGYWGGYPEKAIATGSYGSYDQQSYRVRVEGRPWPTSPNIGLYWYVLGRVTDDGHFRVKAALDGNSGTVKLYVRLLDTDGYDSLDYYVCDYDPSYPVIVELEVQGDVVTGRVSNGAYSNSVTYDTTITWDGDVGIGGEWPWGYAVGYFDNFEVYANSAIAPATCGDQGTVYLESDINKDCRVDFYDLQQLSSDWLKVGAASLE